MTGVSVIIPAAGLSKRLSPAPARRGGIKGFAKRKPFILLGARPMLAYVIDVFKHISSVKEIILVVNRKDLKLAEKYFGKVVAKIITGGPTRSHSVYNGIKALGAGTDIVLIHDGARPFVTKDIVNRSIAQAQRFGAAVAAVPVIPTIKRIDEGGFVASTLNRKLLWEVQTPQVFKRNLIIRAFKGAGSFSDDITDDAMLVEKMGRRVKLVIGSYQNIKITTADDLATANAMLKNKRNSNARFGLGYDLHRLVRGRKLVLGGINVPGEKGLSGHSDADALLHAVIDALLGAAGLGDIGEHFPDTDKKYKDISSKVLLKETAKIIYGRGYLIGNIDAIIILEKPKLGILKEKMAQQIAEILNISKANVNVKAKTNEGLDATGKGQAIAAYAIATLIGVPRHSVK